MDSSELQRQNNGTAFADMATQTGELQKRLLKLQCFDDAKCAI